MVRLDSLRLAAGGFVVLAWLAAARAHAQPVPGAAVTPARVAAPSTHAALEATLRSLSLDPLCTAEGAASSRCEARVTPPGTSEPLTLRAVAHDETRTVFLSVPDLARAPADAPETPARLRHLAELNWELLLGKLEWNAASGEIRLTMVLPTHGGLDRDALGAMVRALISLAGRLAPALRTAHRR